MRLFPEHEIQVMTFGAPMVTDAAGGAKLKALLPVMRVTHERDPVPLTPLESGSRTSAAAVKLLAKSGGGGQGESRVRRGALWKERPCGRHHAKSAPVYTSSRRKDALNRDWLPVEQRHLAYSIPPSPEARALRQNRCATITRMKRLVKTAMVA